MKVKYNVCVRTEKENAILEVPNPRNDFEWHYPLYCNSGYEH